MKTVLVVTREGSERDLLRDSLSRRGFRVLEAASIEEAESLVTANVDLVLLEPAAGETQSSWLGSLLASSARPKVAFLAREGAPSPATVPVLPARGPDELGTEVERLLGATASGRAGAAPEREAPNGSQPEPAPALEHDRSAGQETPASGPIAEKRPRVTRSSLPRVLAALRDAYARSLPDKLAALARAVHAAVSESPGPGALGQATLLAHRFHGTAASYGYPALGEAAGRLEEALESLAVLPEGERPRRRAELEDLLQEVLASGEGGVPADEPRPALTAVSPGEGAQAPDEGARARVVAAGPGETRPGAERASPFVQVGTARILVVDRDPEVRTRVTAIGGRQLIDVVTASSAPAALGLARELPPDAALLAIDPADPEVSFELAEALRAMPRATHLPIGFTSSELDLEYHVAATHVGASLFLSKPFDDDDFTTTVQQLLASRQSERPRVLILDDDHSLAIRLAAVLGADGMDTHVIEDPARVIDALDEVHPDALLLDLMLPGLSGIEVCRMLRILPRWQELPILFITSQGNLESRMAAFAAGADDYLVKPLVDEELRSRIEVRVERSRLRREREERDALTGLLMRRAFVQDFAIRLAEAQRHGRPLTLSLLDLDHFKAINDTRGHLTGDRVLKGLGGLLERRFRNEDMRGRWGGEEFILAFPGERADVILPVVERLLQEFRAQKFVSDRGEELAASFSAGVATFPDDGTTIEELLQAADRRLYLAKARGRGRVVARD